MGSAFRHKSIRYRPIMQEKNDPVIRHGFAGERRRVFVCSARTSNVSLRKVRVGTMMRRRDDHRSSGRAATPNTPISGEFDHSHCRAATRGPPHSDDETAGHRSPPYALFSMVLRRGRRPRRPAQIQPRRAPISGESAAHHVGRDARIAPDSNRAKRTLNSKLHT